jgi:hypothetical protein
MKGPYSDPAKIARAKALMAGPLGRELVRFPMQFAQPVIIGSVPERGQEPQINNGSATLLRIADREFAVTCEHVLEKYRRQRDQGQRKFVFQIGMLELDVEARLVDARKELDLAVIDITGLRHRNVSVRGGDFQFHEPPAWPPQQPSDDELVSIGGFPGAMRQPLVGDHIEFDTFGIGAQPITSSHSDRLAFQLQREFWVSSFGSDMRDFTDMAGMSGGPVMVMRKLHWDMAGFITHFSESWDLLFATPATRVRSDGTLL